MDNQINSIIWVFIFIILFNSIFQIIKKLPAFKDSSLLFLIQVSCSFLIIIIGYRFLLCVGLGLHPSVNASGMVSNGIIFCPVDMFSYLSWASQAHLGSFFLMDLNTIDPHRALYCNPFFFAIGRISAWLNLPTFAVFFMAGIFAVPLVLSSIFFCARYLGLSDKTAKLATVFAAFSSGLTGLLLILGRLLHFSAPVGTDVKIWDSIISATLLVYPLHSFALGMMGLTILLMLSLDVDNIPKRTLFIRLSLLFVAASLFALIHPYETVLFGSSYFIYCLLSIRTGYVLVWRRRLVILIVISIAIMSVAIYYYIIGKYPVWNHIFNSSLSALMKQSRIAWIIGYGFTLPLALLGGLKSFKNSQYEKCRWLAIWVLLLSFIFIIVNTKNIKISDGGYFPMCILAALGLSEMLSKIEGTSINVYKIIGKITVALVIVALLLTFPIYLLKLHPYYYDSEILSTVHKMRSISRDRFPKVLCNSETGMLLTTMGFRIFSGHWGLTPNVKQKRINLIEAGIDENKIIDYARLTTKEPLQVNKNNLMNILKNNKFDYILLRKDLPAYQFIKNIDGVSLVECGKRYCLYSLRDD